ncbi:MAG: copper-binding protein [Pelistega sp.]|nr:copper-binding protein [Pelistega sp.]
MKKRMGAALIALVTGLGLVSLAQAQEQAKASGEVRRIDAAKGKIAIKHGAISDLKLPAMTLVYNIAPALLQQVNAGDQVNFTAKHENNQYIILEIKAK